MSQFRNLMIKTLDSNGHEYVDLGLPSGTLWATCNIGSSTPEGYGNYYAWGETTTKSIYNWVNYFDTETANKSDSWGSLATSFYKYDTNLKTELDLEDDIAYISLGGNWHIPTETEFRELCNNCTKLSVTINSIEGVLFTSNINGNTIFFPYTGYYVSKYYQTAVEYYRGTLMYYWTSSLRSGISSPNRYAICMSGGKSSSDKGSVSWDERKIGMTIRPVCSFK